MDVLYQRGQAAVAEVMADLPDPPSYSAVRATLRVLEEKGHVRHREDGPRYVYLPAVPRDLAQRTALDHVLKTFFNGSAEQAVVALLEIADTELSEGEFQRLAERVKRARQEGR